MWQSVPRRDVWFLLLQLLLCLHCQADHPQVLPTSTPQLSAERPPRGIGLQFRRVLWYHFPKTGGTSMRFLLHGFCRQHNLNLTAHYGLPDECATPFACHSGSRVHFTYGHVRDNFVSYSAPPPPPRSGSGGNDRTLFVFMIREPLSWLLSRHQHTIRKMQVDLRSMTKHQRQQHLQRLPSLVESAVQHGDKYFNFLPDRVREAAGRGFQETVLAASRAQLLRQRLQAAAAAAAENHKQQQQQQEEGSSGSSSSSSDSSSDSSGDDGDRRPSLSLDLAASPAGLSSALDLLLLPPLAPPLSLPLLTQPPAPRSSAPAAAGGAPVLVLVTEYFEESLLLLDHVFATTHFSSGSGSSSSSGSSSGSSSSSSSGSGRFRNRAQAWQDQGLFSTSPAEMKAVSRLLEGHQAVYQACLRAFLSRCAGVGHAPAAGGRPSH